jgi:type I restriction enzyme S subunit
MNNDFEKLENHVFVTKLAGFEHTEYIQNNQTHTKENIDDIPLVQGKNIRHGFFVKNHDWFIRKEISDKLIRSKLNKKCILVPYVGSNLGEVGIFYNDYECHMASNIAKIELIDEYFDIEFLKYYLQSNTGQKYLFQAKQGSSQPNITMEAIRNTLVFNIDKKRQTKIAKTLKIIDDKILNNNRINQELEKLAKTLYDYWFVQFDFPDENNRPNLTSIFAQIKNLFRLAVQYA